MTLQVERLTSLASITADEWDRLANPHAGLPHAGLPHAGLPHAGLPLEGVTMRADPIDRDNPFISHAFLSALETSGCVGENTGWLPCHLVVRNSAGEALAACPLYLKSHSMGEYVFDHSWAEALQRAGGRYYPKLQLSVPFTPVTGPRLLVAPGEQAAEAEALLIAAIAQSAAELQCSSAHVTFATDQDASRLGEAGFLERLDQQFHFENDGFASFEDFLGKLASRKRKMIRRERRDALANGISIEWLSGDAITPEHWFAFFEFYLDTGSRKWGRPYLNRQFFESIGASMADRIVLIMAKREGRWIAGAINFTGQQTLYGRNWGCVEDHPFLHFEVCYYQAIDYAIAHGLKRVEAGAQGEHKLMRGYRPVITRSMHFIRHTGLRQAVADYLPHERSHVLAAQEALGEATPFRRGELQGGGQEQP
jgi:uncharacterized protein